jgi:HK97 family phage prohead protease
VLIKTRLANSPVEVGADRRLSFYAALFSSPTKIVEGGREYTEVIGRNAFDDFLATDREVIGNVNHHDRLTFARRTDGSLLLQQDPKGLFASAYLPDDAIGNAVVKAHAEGRITGASFQFAPIVDRTLKSGWTERTKVHLLDVCVAIDEEPAYPQTADQVHLRTAGKDHSVLLTLLRYQKWKLESKI